ncbi:MAG TPA: hypothetical protein VFC33_14700 [Acidimicrobiia bacterium]|nr:hypothetical protein [Acidimicrobiia bacterium]
MIESTDRVEQFKADIADMRLKDPSIAREQQLLRLGGVMLVAGLVISIASYFGSHSAAAAAGGGMGASQGDYIVVALIGVTVSVVGAALFLRYSIAQFLRFWMARLIYEQQAQTDRIVATTTKADGLATKS